MLNLRASTSLGAIIVSVFAGHNAHAQSAVSPPSPATLVEQPASPSIEAPAAADGAAAAPDIVVTGTRLARDGSMAPTPVTAVSSALLLQSAPSNLPDALNKLPQFTGSTSPTAGATLNAGSLPLGNYLNLRGLGSQRLLVLLNGQRVPPTTNTNAVDVNVLPQLLVNQVDVVTGGASAVYGSDAVSGVVNFVLDERFRGLKAVAQAGLSNYGDALSYRYGAAIGHDFGDRIHVLASYEHYTNKGLPSLFDRDWAPYSGVPVGAGSAALPLRIVFNARRNNQNDNGVVLSGALLGIPGGSRGVQFRPDGSLAPFDVGQVTETTNTSIGGDGAVYAEPRNGGTSIAGSLKTDQAFGRVAFDISDRVQLVVQGDYALSRTSFNAIPNNVAAGAAGGIRQITIFADNPYLRPEVASLLTTAGQTSFSLGRFFGDIPVTRQQSRTEFYSGQVGLKGDVGAWKWDVNYVYGKATQSVAFNEFDGRKLYAAIDAVRDPATGRIVCGVTLRNPTLMPDCIPINVMGDGNITREAFNFTRADSRYRIVNTMQYATANLRGNLFNLPAGPVALAVGAEYRRQTLDQTTNTDPALFGGTGGAAARAAYFNGIRGVPSGALISYSINVGSGAGAQVVKEAYGEVAIPIFKDKPFARDLSLDLAVRYTDYRTSGPVTSWKVGGSWTPVDGLRFRANQSRDIAAPSLYNLYAGTNIVTTGITDPLTKVTSIGVISNSGNINLKPEFADTTTFGVVLKPRGVPGLTFSVDAYRVSIKGAIDTQSAISQLLDCFNSNGTAPVCSLIDRPISPTSTAPGNYPTTIRVVPQNLANLLTKGIDIEASYRFALDGLFPGAGGDLTLRAFVNYLDAYNTQATAGSAVRNRVGRVTADVDGQGLPRWKGILMQTYSNDRLGLSISERFTGKYTLGSPNIIYAVPVVAPNRVYVDTNLSYDFGQDKNVQAFVNVQNLFNIDPPQLNTALITNLSVSTDKAAYDVIGRYFTAGVRVKF